ncbi:MAG TPA: LLM class flavin-dependent oxidoreductase [Chloroflexota bacterium]|nr:LLM class flavin-dependent oxidoreductase [Chloroflexota bacterium]
MKVCMFHLMPYRVLPNDFKEHYKSVWVDIPSELFDPQVGAQLYDEYLDQLEYAATLGFDGICVNEHHQNGYGLMPSPNLMAASLARRTKDVAIIVLGNSVALYNPPTRVAEEFAMLDCLTGGRLVAGFPVGTSQDTNFAYSVNPATLREQYYEAVDLIVDAWTRPEVFSFDGKYTQLRYVNIWPRPIQKPHPPVWIPGGRSIETWGWSLDHNFVYASLSYGGYKRAQTTMDHFWQVADKKGYDRNPYRAGFLQLVVVGNSRDEIDDKYAQHVEYFYNQMLHVWPGYQDAPGYRSIDTIKASLTGGTAQLGDAVTRYAPWKQLVDNGNVVVGTPSQVAEELEHLARSLHVGHLMLLNQIGSMPPDLARENIRLTATEVLPKIRHLWDGEWEDHWWIASQRSPAAAGALS